MDEQHQPSGGPWNNGLLASSYVPLTDVDATLAPRILTALERARIAAYLTASDDGRRLRLHVASGERSDARTIVATVLRAADPAGGPDDVPIPAGPGPNGPTESTGPTGPTGPTGSAEQNERDQAGEPDRPGELADPLAGVDTDAEFAALIADWHVDTHEAIRAAERDLSREDEDWRLRLHREPVDEDELTWLDDDHYVPPNPPPIPRPTVAVVVGLLLVAGSIVLLAAGAELGLAFQTRLLLAVAGIVSATVVFVLRLRKYRDEDDDGAVL